MTVMKREYIQEIHKIHVLSSNIYLMESIDQRLPTFIMRKTNVINFKMINFHMIETATTAPKTFAAASC